MRTLVFIMALAGLLYTALALYVWIFQARFIYFPNQPTRHLDLTPGDIGLDYIDVQFTASDGVTLHGWYIAAGDGPVVLYFHGNAGNISHRLDSIHFFHQLGLSVFIIDYRGYGRSSGTPDEPGTYRDAMAAWHYLTGERHIAAHRIVLFGRSLGGAVAAWLAANVSPGALILQSTFSSVPDMARKAFPYLPAGLARIRYDTESLLPSITIPILLMHSRDDEVIPYELAQKLAAAAPGQARFLSLRGGHNDAQHTADRAYVETLREFITQHTGVVLPTAPDVLQ